MYVYIYDTFLAEGKYTRILAEIESRITDLGLNGKIGRLGVAKKTGDLVRDEIKRGAKTIIAVGNDETVEKIARCLYATGVPLGIIPIGKKNNHIAESLGIDQEIEACDTLSARRVKKLDMGAIGNFYFLSKISTSSENLTLNINNGYSVELRRPGTTLRIVNLATGDLAMPAGVRFSPNDGLLRLLVESRTKKNLLFTENNFESVFTFKKAEIKSPQGPVIFNGYIKAVGSVEVWAEPEAISVIVGKNRNF